MWKQKMSLSSMWYTYSSVIPSQVYTGMCNILSDLILLCVYIYIYIYLCVYFHFFQKAAQALNVSKQDKYTQTELVNHEVINNVSNTLFYKYVFVLYQLKKM